MMVVSLYIGQYDICMLCESQDWGGAITMQFVVQRNVRHVGSLSHRYKKCKS